MKHGFIKCAAITPKIAVGAIEENTESIIEAIALADGAGSHIAVLPELAITGATLCDMFSNETILNGALSALLKIAERTAHLSVISVVGLPVSFDFKTYNCAAVIKDGQILGIIPKTNLTKEESRYFASADMLPQVYNTLKLPDDFAPLSKNLVFRHAELDSFRFGVQIGSDLFGIDNTADNLAKAGATFIVNSAAIPFTPENEKKIKLFAIGTSLKLTAGYVISLAGDGESTTDNVYSGGGIIAENGEILKEGTPFKDTSIISEIDTDKMAKLRNTVAFPKRPDDFTDILFFSPITDTVLTREITSSPFDLDRSPLFYEKTFTAAANGLKKRMEHTAAKKMVLGISGGLDSTMALLTCIRATKLLGKKPSDIIAVTMPCFGTSNRTKTNAELLCDELGVTLRTVDIKNAVSLHFKDISHDEANHNVTYENAQARERTQILMDIANDEGGIVVGTGDLSELALGFATYNGDQMSMYGVNASIPKTLIRALTRYEAQNLNEKTGEILLDIVNTPVSPELLPPDENGNIEQFTEDLVGPYELHDFFIYNLIKNNFSLEKIYYLATLAFKETYSPDIVLKWLKVFTRRFINAQFKRSCMPDGVQVTNVSFSPRGSFNMPSDMVGKIWLQELENL